MIEGEENFESLKKKLHLEGKLKTPERMLKSLSIIVEHVIRAKREAERNLE